MALHRAVPIGRRVRLDQVDHASLEPGGSDSLGLTESLRGVVWRWLDQSADAVMIKRFNIVEEAVSLLERRGMYRGSFPCLCFSSWGETARLICGGAIPHNK